MNDTQKEIVLQYEEILNESKPSTLVEEVLTEIHRENSCKINTKNNENWSILLNQIVGAESTLEATEWVHHGGIATRRSALNIDDPESWQSLWMNKFGSMIGFPYKEFGFNEPQIICPHCGKEIHR